MRFAPLVPRLRALTPIASTALRLAFEIGSHLAEKQPAHDRQSALDLANHCVGIILEEAQRFLFGQFLQGALRNPSAADGQFGRLIFGFAVTEALGIFALLIAFLVLFS